MIFSQQQFDRTRRLALSLAGITLLERHRDLLDRRSRRLGILDSTGLDSLLTSAENNERAAAQRLFDLLTTKFTGFFRHPQHFRIAAKHAQEVAGHRGQPRLWSAAAATGEEPYSLAMAVLERFQRDDPPISILATDIAVSALETAQQGEYGEPAVRSLDPTQRERFLGKVGIGQRWRVAPGVRGLVEFRPLNLASGTWSVEGPFDVIFCRNVLMYLERSCRDAVLERMVSLLAPDGLLVLDPTEHPGQAACWLTPTGEGVYSRRCAARQTCGMTLVAPFHTREVAR